MSLHHTQKPESVSPVYLCSIMPKESEINDKATDYFYKELKKQATSEAEKGNNGTKFEVPEIEMSLGDYESRVVTENLAKKLFKEKFTIVEKAPTSIEFTWTKKSESPSIIPNGPINYSGQYYNYNYPPYAAEIRDQMEAEYKQYFNAMQAQAQQYYSNYYYNPVYKDEEKLEKTEIKKENE